MALQETTNQGFHMNNSQNARPVVKNTLSSRISTPSRTSQTTDRNPASGELVLIRGLPGSGKSTMAREYARKGYAHLKADMFFEYGGEYQYDASRIRDAHTWCQRMTREALVSGRSAVVSNTSTQLREMAPYQSMSGKVRVIEATGRWQNTHGVPAEMLERMAQRWEPLAKPGR
jgi:chloramphenicol 3-O-phosphotransferase